MTHFKRIIVLIICAVPFFLKAQQYEKYEGNNIGWSINANVGPSLFYGDLKQYGIIPITTFHNEWRASGGIIISKKIFSFLSLRSQVLVGQLAGTKRFVNAYFKSNIVDYNMNLKLDISEFFKPEEDRKSTFYVYAGLGFVSYRTKKYSLFKNTLVDARGYDLNGAKLPASSETIMPLGMGIDYNLTYNVSMNFDYSRRIVNSDKIDATVGKSKYDMYDYISVGVTYHFRGPKDSDKDGIPDNFDKCPETPIGVIVDENGCPVDKDKDGIADYLDKCPNIAGNVLFSGCPDTDGDGIQDNEDKCPKVKGIAQFNGCPDTDGDGVEDSKDSCLNEKGLVEFNGCPDSDGDGIIDSKDKCPKDKGLVQFNGCPDTDGDGIADNDDKCPKDKGLVKYNGCPDTDGDGIPDSEDKCPKVAGLAINLGCPAVKKEVLKVFEKALTGIQFETGKDVIKPVSFAILDQVVKAMIDNPTYNLEINGHTDNVGDDQKNLVLSQKRADAVKKYLVTKGVTETRIKSTGFGATKPVADNSTPAGKAKNRRVEFKVVFQTLELE